MNHGHDLSYDCAFYIHADDRTITTDAESTIELMQYDHNSTLYGFQADRFIDGHDLSNCSEVRIHYVNTTTGGISNSDVYIVTDLSVGGWTGSEDEHVKFSWLVSNNATQYAGSLSFLVEFICTVDDKIEYSWHSNIFNNIKVLSGMNNTKTIIERESDAIAGINSNIGDLDDLNTTSKSNLVEAINSIKTNQGGDTSDSGHPCYFAVSTSDVDDLVKTATVDDEFALSDGAVVYVRFTNGLRGTDESSGDISLNINGTGDVLITFNGGLDGSRMYGSETWLMYEDGILPLVYSETYETYVSMNSEVAFKAIFDDSGNYISEKFNELNAKIGDLNKLEVDAKDNLVDAANLLNEDLLTVFRYIGDMLPIEDMDKESLSEAIIGLYTQIGDIETALDSIITIQNTLIGGDSE